MFSAEWYGCQRHKTFMYRRQLKHNWKYSHQFNPSDNWSSWLYLRQQLTYICSSLQCQAISRHIVGNNIRHFIFKFSLLNFSLAFDDFLYFVDQTLFFWNIWPETTICIVVSDLTNMVNKYIWIPRSQWVIHSPVIKINTELTSESKSGYVHLEVIIRTTQSFKNLINKIIQNHKLSIFLVINKPTNALASAWAVMTKFGANTSTPGLILGLCPANERRRYKVTSSLIGWAQI